MRCVWPACSITRERKATGFRAPLSFYLSVFSFSARKRAEKEKTDKRALEINTILIL
jgi:hypothetical protein